MEFFRYTRAVRLRGSPHGQYLVAKADEETVHLHSDGSSASAWWSVEFVPNSDSILRLKSCYGKYLVASYQRSLFGMTVPKVLQSPPPILDSSLEWEPVMGRTHVKLRTQHGTLLRANRGVLLWGNSVTHELPYSTAIQDWVLWDVEREEGGSSMEFFRNARAVRLRSGPGQYLVAEDDEETVDVGSDGSSASARWSVEFVPNSASVLRLKSRHGKYLAASDQPTPLGMTGCKVLQSSPPLLDSSVEWKLMMEGTHVKLCTEPLEWEAPIRGTSSLEREPTKVKLRTLGTNIKLRSHYGTFLHANGGHPPWGDPVTHDLPHSTSILWHLDVVEREEEGSVTNVDNKASEEVSAAERRYEKGEGSSVTKSPPADSGLIRESDGVRYRSHFWKLKSLLLDDSGRKDVLVKGGSGTTALVREVCADVREHFGTIAWISIPQKMILS